MKAYRELKAKIIMVPPIRLAVFSLNDGDVKIEYPSRITREEFNDLSCFMQILLRNIERSIPGANDPAAVVPAKEAEQAEVKP